MPISLYPSTLDLVTGTLSGSGAITLDDTCNGPILAGTFTQSSGHTINGYGEITASLTNNSTVNANLTSKDLNLLTNNMTNNSVMEATNGGILNIGAITITQGALVRSPLPPTAPLISRVPPSTTEH